MYLYEIDYKNYEKKHIQYTVYVKHITMFDMLIFGEKFDFKTLLIRLYFYIISKNKLDIYYVKDGNTDEIIHTSYVIGECYKFPFMKKSDIEIGPCYTSENYRGKGIYKNVLNFINNECSSGKKRLI